MEENFSYGLIGCGRISAKHAWAFKRNNAILSWACDLEKAKIRALNKLYKFEHNTIDYNDVLKDPKIDAVSVATDHASHARITIDALKSGKHVLVEKPMATKISDAKKMLKQAEKRDLVLSVVSQHQYDPLLQEIKKVIDKKMLGRIIVTNAICQCHKTKDYYSRSYWRGKKEFEGGSVLINQAIHIINVTNWLVGSPKIVKCIKKNFKFGGIINTEDSACVLLEYEDGAIGTLAATNASTFEVAPKIEIIGMNGSISFDLGFPNKLLYFNLTSKQLEKDVLRKFESAIKTRIMPPKNLTYYGVGHYYQVKDFIRCIRQMKEPMANGRQGLESLTVIEKIYNNCWNRD